jgi:hypothetical protein
MADDACWVGNRTTRGNARAAWERAHGEPVPPGLWVLHTCDNPPCLNPAHLYVDTPGRNARDMWERGDRVRADQRPASHCKHGHEFTPENTHLNHGGQRVCRTCATPATRNRWR